MTCFTISAQCISGVTVQLYTDPASVERLLKADGKNSQGFTYAADLKTHWRLRLRKMTISYRFT